MTEEKSVTDGGKEKKESVLQEWRRTSETQSVVFNNLCITGPDRGSFWATFVVIVIPGLHFVARTLPNLIILESASYWAYAIIFLYIVGLNLATLFKVALTDPGIVPRQHPPEGQSEWGWPAVYKDVVLAGVPTQLKFCDTCYFYRPPRTIHCSVCNNCVSDFDHHCPWIGNCVGRRNYTDFVVFTGLSVIDLIIVICGNVLLLVLQGISKYEEGNVAIESSVNSSSYSDSVSAHENFFVYLLRTFPDCFVVTIFLIGVLIPVTMLLVLHITLICRGITTNERIKKISARKRNGMNPCLWFYTQLGLALFRSTPPSAVDGRCGVLYTVKPEEREMQLRRRQQEREADDEDGLLAIVVVPPPEDKSMTKAEDKTASS